MKMSALCSVVQPSLCCWVMESEYLYSVSILIFSHMYKTYPLSCKLMFSISKYMSNTKWTYCTVLSNSQSKQIKLVYYCSKMVY